MRILIAPNAFKNSLDAEEVARAIGEGLLKSRLDCVCEFFPVGDGGDGTGELIRKKFNGALVDCEVVDPFGRNINAPFGLINERSTAVIEMATASGLRLLAAGEADPLRALTRGTGQQVKNALGEGVKKIIIGMGGSATVDGATGILQALGARFLDAAGDELKNLPGGLVELADIDLAGMDTRILSTEVIVLCDVKNTLLGSEGAAATFGPQKGAGPAAVVQLESALKKLRDVALSVTGKDISEIKHGGTAGGAAAGLFAFLGAQLVDGIDYFLQITGFNDALKKADLVITGEGSIDDQTLQGKGPFGVARLAREKNIPVVGLAGNIPLEPSDELKRYFNVLLPISNQPIELFAAMAATRTNLVRTAETLGNAITLGKTPG